MAGPMMGQFAGMAKSMGGAMFGAQVGQGLGALAAEVVGSADVGLPLGPTGAAGAAARATSRAFGEGLGVPADEVRLYLALREAPTSGCSRTCRGCAPRLFGAVEDYARGIVVDPAGSRRPCARVDPQRPRGAAGGAAVRACSSRRTRPQQKAALARLETLLALVEGWVDAVVTGGRRPRCPAAQALRETVRRRRATGGPAEQTFATLVGLELRPRRLREAAALWTELREDRGVDGRDAVWEHPDLLPTADDLDDPAGFVARELDLSALDLSELEPSRTAARTTSPRAERRPPTPTTPRAPA